MPKEVVLQSSFNAGELSPYLQERADLDVYAAGCFKLHNFIPMSRGPISRRVGSKFIAELPNEEVRLIPFRYSAELSFILICQPSQTRIMSEHGLLGDALPPLSADVKNISFAQRGRELFYASTDKAPHKVLLHNNGSWTVEPIVFTHPPLHENGTPVWVEGNFPTKVVLHEQRAWYFGVKSEPLRIWGSRTGMYEDFQPCDYIVMDLAHGTAKIVDKNAPGAEKRVLATHAIDITLYANRINEILWASSGRELRLGTAGAIFSLMSTSTGDVISPKNVKVVPLGYWGSSGLQAETIGTELVVCTRSRRQLLAINAYRDEKIDTKILTQYAEHIIKSEVTDMSTQGASNPVIWCATKAGEIAGCKYEAGQDVLAWFTVDTPGLYKRICAMQLQGEDLIVVAVERNGKLLLEAFENLGVEPARNQVFLDSFVEYKGEKTREIIGLAHLEGLTVVPCVDGWAKKAQVVRGGKITLREETTHCYVGLPYTSRFISAVPQSAQFISAGLARRISSAFITTVNSGPFDYAAEGSDKQFRTFPVPFAPQDNPGGAFTPDNINVNINFLSESQRQARVALIQDKPMPLTITSIAYSINPAGV